MRPRKNVVWFCLLTLLPLVGLDQTSDAAVGYCAVEYLEQCQDMTDPVCLEKYMACGEYKTVIDALALDSTGLGERTRYFRGIAYYGMLQRSRAASKRCNWARNSRQELTAYLLGAQQGKTNLVIDFNYVYQASKIVDELSGNSPEVLPEEITAPGLGQQKTIDGCVAAPPSADELRYMAFEYGQRLLRTLFVGAVPSSAIGDAINKLKTAIQSTIGNVIQMASDIETQIPLRHLAIDASHLRIKRLAQIFANQKAGSLPGPTTFGTASIATADGSDDIASASFEESTDGLYAKALAGTEAFTAIIKSFQERFSAAMGSSDVYDYDRNKTLFIGIASRLKEYSKEFIKQADFLEISGADADTMKKLMQVAVEADSPEAVITRIKGQWVQNSSMECAFFEPKPWYCPTLRDLTQPIP